MDNPIKRYRRRPFVEAIQCTEENFDEIEEFTQRSSLLGGIKVGSYVVRDEFEQFMIYSEDDFLDRFEEELQCQK